jgi:hypothetical protein
MQGKTAVIARGEEAPCNGLYARIDMHHYLQRKTADAIARVEKPPYGGLYAPGVFMVLRRQIARMAKY